MALNPEHSVPPRRTHGIPSQYEEFGFGRCCDSVGPLYRDPQVGAVPDWGGYIQLQGTPSFTPSSLPVLVPVLNLSQSQLVALKKSKTLVLMRVL
jgi:hypothetical protein